MYPLSFQPLFQRYLWGGHQLETVLHKPSGPENCAESWEIVDHAQYQSVVEEGAFQGLPLNQLMKSHGAEMVGADVFESIHSPRIPENLRGRFPLLLKFLDANQTLSVQVHPDNQMAANLPTPDLGKTEAWYVMHSNPGAKIYAGLKQGVSENDFRSAIKNGRVLETLHCFEPQIGDCVYIPAGTIHAIGEGLLIAEIQQASNTTFRVYDWDRVDDNGNSRPLHIDSSIQATHFSCGPVDPVTPQPGPNAHSEVLIECEQFRILRWSGDTKPVTTEMGDDDSFHLMMMTKGTAQLNEGPDSQIIETGRTILLPAALKKTTITLAPGAEFLQIHLPQ